jgi:hypothetical protein
LTLIAEAAGMSWVKLDDGFTDHPKIAHVGAIGAWLQIQALCYCNRNLTDGFVPYSVARAFLARGVVRTDDRGVLWTLGEHSGHQGLDLSDIDWPGELVKAGIWEVVAGGYRIHDYDHYQRRKVEVLAERRRHADRQQNYTRRKADAVSDGVTDAGPVPVPVPVPRETLSLTSFAQGDGSPKSHFAEFWAMYPRKRHKPAAFRAWQVVKGDAALEAVVAGVERWKASAQWGEGYVEDPATFLRQRQWEDDPPAARAGRSEDTTAQQVARIRARLTKHEATHD